MISYFTCRPLKVSGDMPSFLRPTTYRAISAFAWQRDINCLYIRIWLRELMVHWSLKLLVVGSFWRASSDRFVKCIWHDICNSFPEFRRGGVFYGVRRRKSIQVSGRRDFNHIYVVFELMQSDLHQVKKPNDDLTKEHYQFFLYQLLRALKYIHTGR